ncbi:MAG: FHA domain-containing protein [Dysgonamonadaceae bacterium]|jgi:uncharacterized Zn finger protein (UPF0148 family)|nr:FHA domain-containing protein [Dysgonamonadaceae bacterium]
MVRCKNCGWENPNENAPCEKCGATLAAWTGEQPTVRNMPTENLNARKTAFGCPKCGYPLRPSDTRCPNCDAEVETPPIQQKDDDKSVQQPSGYGRTVIASNAAQNGSASNSRRLVALLITYSIRPQGDIFQVFEGKNFIGRDIATNINIKNDAKMSDKHLSILYRAVDNKFKFKDEQSSNGTFINGSLIDEGELKSGDVITAGSTKFLFFAIPAF